MVPHAEAKKIYKNNHLMQVGHFKTLMNFQGFLKLMSHR